MQTEMVWDQSYVILGRIVEWDFLMMRGNDSFREKKSIYAEKVFSRKVLWT